MSAIHWSTVLTCKNRLSFSLLPFALIPQYLKRFNWSIQWNPLAFSLFSLASIISRSFQTVRRVREAWMFGLCLFRPSRQSNIPTSVPRRAKIKCSLPRENKFPPPPAGFTLMHKYLLIPKKLLRMLLMSLPLPFEAWSENASSLTCFIVFFSQKRLPRHKPTLPPKT